MDPVPGAIAHLFLGGLLLAAALHKAFAPQQFLQAIAGYRLVPLGAVPSLGVIVTLGEAALGSVAAAGSAAWADSALACAMAVLTGYAVLILVSLRRGIRHIGCGCLAFGARSRELLPAMAVRNLMLAAIGVIGLVPLAPRHLLWFDFLTILGGVAVLTLLFAIFDVAMVHSKREAIL